MYVPDTDDDYRPQKKKSRKTSQTRKWNKQEIEAVDKLFDTFMKLFTLPGKAIIEEKISGVEALKDRNWIDVKNRIRNVLVTKKRQLVSSKKSK